MLEKVNITATRITTLLPYLMPVLYKVPFKVPQDWMISTSESCMATPLTLLTLVLLRLDVPAADLLPDLHHYHGVHKAFQA